MMRKRQTGRTITAFSVALLCAGHAMADEPSSGAAQSDTHNNIALNNNDGQSAGAEKLAAAIESPSKNLSPVNALISTGVDVNAILPDGRNLLMVAVTSDNYAAVRLLLAAGAKPDLSTELFLSSIEGDIKRVRAALDKGVKVDSEDYDGGTPLIFAVSRKRIDVVQLLIERGANVNHQNQAGWTALMYAANYMEPLSAQLLLKSGANLYLKNKSGKNAINELLIYDPDSSDVFPYQKRDLLIMRKLFHDKIGTAPSSILEESKYSLSEQQVQKLNGDFFQALNKLDLMRFDQIVDDGAIFTNDSVQVLNKKQVQRILLHHDTKYIKNVRVLVAKVVDSTAVVTGQVWVREKNTNESYVFTNVFVKTEDTDWKLVSLSSLRMR